MWWLGIIKGLEDVQECEVLVGCTLILLRRHLKKKDEENEVN
jgi:hypothetical protein